jgi:hypothetical protein
MEERKREREMATRVRGLSRLPMKGGESRCTEWDMGGLPTLTFKPSVDATALPFRFPYDRVVQSFDKLKRWLLQPHSSGTVESDSSRSCDCHPRRHGALHVLSYGSAGTFAAHPCWPQQLLSHCMWMDVAARASASGGSHFLKPHKHLPYFLERLPEARCDACTMTRGRRRGMEGGVCEGCPVWACSGSQDNSQQMLRRVVDQCSNAVVPTHAHTHTPHGASRTQSAPSSQRNRATERKTYCTNEGNKRDPVVTVRRAAVHNVEGGGVVTPKRW